MNAFDIRNKVQKEADSNLGDVVDKLLLLLKQVHSHQSHTNECFCEYCNFIRGDYTKFKLAFHHAKKRFENYDGLFLLVEEEIINSTGMDSLSHLLYCEKIVARMKAKKNAMLSDGL